MKNGEKSIVKYQQCSIVVDQSTLDPKFEGLSPGTAGTRRKMVKNGEKRYFKIPAVVAQWLTNPLMILHDPKIEFLNPDTAGTGENCR